MQQTRMKEQWQEMALQNPFFGITSWPEFEDTGAIDLDFFWQLGEIHARNLLSRTPLRNTEELSMLEIGCGVGRMTQYFAKIFGQVTAVDVAPEMIRRANQFWSHLENVRFIEGSGSDLGQVASNSMDFVFSFYVLNHVVDPNIVLSYVREAGRVLKTGGHALLHMRVCALDPWSSPVLMSRMRRIGRSPKARLWWNQSVERAGLEMKTDISSQYARFESWHGSEVPWPALEATLRDAGLTHTWTDIAPLAATNFAFLVLKKATNGGLGAAGDRASGSLS